MQRPLSPNLVICVTTFLFILVAIVATTAGLNWPVVRLNENQVLYLFSTSAQVIAAIYGLTLTGFIFVRNELTSEEFADATLAEAIDSLKARYFVLLLFITVLVGTTLFLANLAISFEGSNAEAVNAILINSGQAAFVTSLLAIAYFIFDVISPKRVQQASQSLQDKLDPPVAGEDKGSLEIFLANYNQIERLLTAAGERLLDIPASEKRFVRRMPNSRLAEFLFGNERIDQHLYGRLRNLISLRNSIIHGADPGVSATKVAESEEVLRQLRAALDDSGGDDTQGIVAGPR